MVALVCLAIGHLSCRMIEFWDWMHHGRPKNAEVVEQLYLLCAAASAFREDEGQFPPEKNREFVSAMLGENSSQREYLSPELFTFNDRGEVVDPWGTPFSITESWIVSAGENGRFETEAKETDDYRMIEARIDPKGRIWKLLYYPFDMPGP